MAFQLKHLDGEGEDCGRGKAMCLMRLFAFLQFGKFRLRSLFYSKSSYCLQQEPDLWQKRLEKWVTIDGRQVRTFYPDHALPKHLKIAPKRSFTQFFLIHLHTMPPSDNLKTKWNAPHLNTCRTTKK